LLGQIFHQLNLGNTQVDRQAQLAQVAAGAGDFQGWFRDGLLHDCGWITTLVKYDTVLDIYQMKSTVVPS
jgi:hypothetical protein